jgi:hypothetical protein
MRVVCIPRAIYCIDFCETCFTTSQKYKKLVHVNKQNPVSRRFQDHAFDICVVPKAFKSFTQAATNVPKKATKKIGNNDKCPCGSKKKYKKCCKNKPKAKKSLK